MSTLTGPDILNKDVSSLIQSNQTTNETNLARSLNTTTTTDTQKFTNTDEKIFSNAATTKTTKPKSFGVFITKQVMKPIELLSAIKDDAVLRATSSAKLTSMSNKSGSTLRSDADIDKAQADILSQMYSMKSTEFASKSNSTFDYSLGVDLPVAPTSGLGQYASIIPKKPDPNIWIDPDTGRPSPTVDQIAKSYTTDPDILNFLPNTVSVSEYDQLRNLMNGELGSYNSCPDLAKAFGFDKNLFGLDSLLNGLMSLLNAMGLHQLIGFINCLKDIFKALTTGNKMDIVNAVANTGAVPALNEVMAVVPIGLITDPKRTAYNAMGRNHVLRFDPITGLPTNTYRSTDMTNAADGIFSKIGMVKDRVFAAVAPKNDSILDGLAGEPVYDIDAIKGVNPEAGFSDYALGDKDKLLRNVPTMDMSIAVG